MLEDPRISTTMAWGYPEKDEPPEPRCPRCGCVCETVFLIDEEVVGCNECVETMNAWECEECYGEI